MFIERVRIPGNEQIAEAAKVSAAVVEARLCWIDEYSTLDEKEALYACSSTARAALVEGWISFRDLLQLDLSICEVFSESEPNAVLADLGRFSARRMLAASALGVRDVHVWLNEACARHDERQNFGTAAYEAKGRRGEVTHDSPSCFSAMWCASAAGFYEQVLLWSGVVRPSVRETECHTRGDAHCRFELTWK